MELLVLVVGGVVVGVGTAIVLDRMGWSAKAKAKAAAHADKEAKAFAAGAAVVDEVVLTVDEPATAPGPAFTPPPPSEP
ncbi:MAG: hypothetical protein U0Q07_06925 [Acidimicrobiales bacterium]